MGSKEVRTTPDGSTNPPTHAQVKHGLYLEMKVTSNISVSNKSLVFAIKSFDQSNYFFI